VILFREPGALAPDALWEIFIGFGLFHSVLHGIRRIAAKRDAAGYAEGAAFCADSVQ